MRQTLSRGMVVAAAATGVLSLYGGGSALADSGAQGAAQGSAGVLSGNNVQAPVNVPVNVCGNTVDVVAALNPAFGNSCVNAHGSTKDHSAHRHRPVRESTPPPYGGDESTPPPHGGEVTSPPPYSGDESTPPSGGETTPPSGGETTPPPPPGGGHHYGAPPSLPDTGGEGPAMLGASAASAALIGAGALLYRRGRAARR
ncbi:chaplin [Streptomyces sp. NPDC050743]|uniref:chaplin n=1 Tax=Streptomyces sp. NPDC050743 TaxID=3365634 RepID=UPI00378E020A